MHLGKLFKEGLRDLIRWANQDDYAKDSAPVSMSSFGIGSSTKSISGSSGSIDNTREMNFTVTNATGGKIVKVYWYDHKLSREYTNLHLITDNEDLAEELAQIITRESLQR
jgi:hypothetical protein